METDPLTPPSPEVEHITKCKECGSRSINTDETRGEISCVDCGLVLEDTLIDPGQEWRVFSAEDGDSRSRVGAPTNVLLHDKGLSTEIAWQNKDYSGRSIAAKHRSQLYRMRKWQQRARIGDTIDRNLAKALPEIARICSVMGLPNSVKEDAAVIYRKSLENSLIRGRSIDAAVASCIYGSCSKMKLGRTLEEVARASRVGKKELSRTYKVIKSKLRLRMDINRPMDYVARFCSALGLPQQVNTQTEAIILRADDLEMTDGKSPTGVAAASIYIACSQLGHHRTQREIADVSDVTEVTIRNRYKELVGGLKLNMDNPSITQYNGFDGSRP